MEWLTPSGEYGRGGTPLDSDKGLRPAVIAVYLRGMKQPGQESSRRSPHPRDLLEFRPWMLALAVFLACAIGIAIMEQARDPRAMWAQVTPAETVTQGR